MSKAFDPESGFIGGFSKVIDTLILSILWIVCCIPVVTVGAASAALYYAYHRAIRQDRGHACKTFWKAFKDNFKQATGVWLILLAFVLLSLFACYLLLVMGSSIPMAPLLLSMGTVVLCFTVVWCIYLFAYQARFESTAANALKNSALLAIANLPRSILLLLIFGAALVVALYKPAMSALVVAVYIWLNNKILEQVFRKLMTQTEMESDEA